MYALVMGANLAHRHFGLPYAYLDDGVFRTFERQLTWFPAVCILMLAATPLLLSRTPARSAARRWARRWYFRCCGTSGTSICRSSASCGCTGPRTRPRSRIKTSAWVDKYFLLCWFPLYFSYLGPAYKELILRNGSDVEGFAYGRYRVRGEV